MKLKKLLVLIMAVCFLVVGCGAKNSYAPMAAYEEYGYYDDSDYGVAAEAMDMEAAYAPASAASGVSGNSYSAKQEEKLPDDAGSSEFSKKIIYNGSMTIRVDDPAETLKTIQAACESSGGYLANSFVRQNSGSSTKYATASFRIPADRLEPFMEEIAGMGEQIEANIRSDDITQSYYDIQARLASAEAEEKQLLALYDRCVNIEEILEVRAQIADVRERIESYQARINVWNNQVAFATLDLTIRETEKTVVQEKQDLIKVWAASDVFKKMKIGLQNSGRFLLNALSAIGIFLAYAIVPVVVLGGIGVLLYFLFRPLVRRHRAKVAEKQAKQIEERERRRAERAKKKAEEAEKAAEPASEETAVKNE